MLFGQIAVQFVETGTRSGNIGMPPCTHNVISCDARTDGLLPWRRTRRAIPTPRLIRAAAHDLRQSKAMQLEKVRLCHASGTFPSVGWMREMREMRAIERERDEIEMREEKIRKNGERKIGGPDPPSPRTPNINQQPPPPRGCP